MKVSLLYVLLLTVACAPKAKVLDTPITAELEEGQSSGSAHFDHSELDTLLSATVDPTTGRVDYATLATRKTKLDAYLAQVENAQLTTLNRSEQLALLINAYNAYTLRLILSAYPDLESIRDLDSPWDTKNHKVGGYTLSLNDIEHGLLRPIFKTPQIHFAVNCAAKGCPPLWNHAFTGATVDKELDDATRRVLSSSDHVFVKGGRLHLTNILNWYGEDFKSDSHSMPEWIAPFSTEAVQDLVKKNGGDPPISWVKYDWSLNSQ